MFSNNGTKICLNPFTLSNMGILFFLTETSNAENEVTVYLIFTDMPARTHTWSSSLFYSRYITVNFRLKYV